MKKVTECRICGGNNLYNFLNLGKMPIPNGFLKEEQLNEAESHYPLEVLVCQDCWLVQLAYVVAPEVMFKNYLYVPSASMTMMTHFRQMRDEVMDMSKFNDKDLVVDVGSNDGLLLSGFMEKKINVLGIDPAENIVKDANVKGIRTLCAFFSEKTANEVKHKYGQAKIITATNVIAHIDNLHDVMRGVKVLLDQEGLFVMEAPYLIDLLDNNEFDTIYHEHLSYFSISPLMKLFELHRLKIVDIRKQEIHGGTVRIYVTHSERNYLIHPRVNNFIIEENLKKLHSLSAYNEFKRRVKIIKRDLVSFLNRIKKEKKTIIGYGASAKGNVLLNYCGITTDLLDYIVDSTSYKHNLYTPGTHIQIYPESKLDGQIPDYALLLSWNFAEEIINKQRGYRERGGQFIITIPFLKII